MITTCIRRCSVVIKRSTKKSKVQHTAWFFGWWSHTRQTLMRTCNCWHEKKLLRPIAFTHDRTIYPNTDLLNWLVFLHRTHKQVHARKFSAITNKFTQKVLSWWKRFFCCISERYELIESNESSEVFCFVEKVRLLTEAQAALFKYHHSNNISFHTSHHSFMMNEESSKNLDHSKFLYCHAHAFPFHAMPSSIHTYTRLAK